MHMPHLLCKETFHTSALDYISDKYICNLVGKYISSYGKLEHAMEKISILRFFNTNLQQPTSSFFPGYGTFPISGCFHYRGHYCISRSRSTMHTMCPHMFVGHHQRMEGKISSIDSQEILWKSWLRHPLPIKIESNAGWTSITKPTPFDTVQLDI